MSINVDTQEVASVTSAVEPQPRTGKRVARRFMPVAVLALLVLAVSVANPAFLRPESLMTAADSGVPLLLLATGAMLVILCGGIDLSVAALASMSSVFVALWVPSLGGWAVAAGVAVGALAGLTQGLVHVVAQVPSFIVTLGGLALWSGIALVASGASTVGMSGGALEWAFTRLGPWRIPSAVLIAASVVILVALVFALTPVRRFFYAVGGAEQAARLAGVPVNHVKVFAFMGSGACAGLAGGLLVARTYSGAPGLADSLLLPAVAAVVIGGTAITGGFGGVGRTVIGVLIITVLRVGLSVAGVDPSIEQIIYGVLVIGAVAVTIDRSKFQFMK